MQLITSFCAHAQDIRTRKFLLRKSLEGFGTEIMKKLRKFQYWAKKLSYKNRVLSTQRFGVCYSYVLSTPSSKDRNGDNKYNKESYIQENMISNYQLEVIIKSH